MSDMRASFKRDLGEVRWRELRIHLQRDSIIWVAPELDLIETAVAVAEDDKAKVEQWISSGLIGKPENDSLDQWEGELDTTFRMLIVQPFILIQTVQNA
jgi:hypothetical protein